MTGSRIRAAAAAVPAAVLLIGTAVLSVAAPAAASVAPCTAQRVAFGAGRSQGATGHGSFVLHFRIHSYATCGGHSCRFAAAIRAAQHGPRRADAEVGQRLRPAGAPSGSRDDGQRLSGPSHPGVERWHSPR